MKLTIRRTALLVAVLIAWPAFAQTDEAAPPTEAPKPPEEAPAEVVAEAPPAEAAPKKSLFAVTEPKLHRWGGLTISGDVWSPQLMRNDYEVALVTGSSGSNIAVMPSDSEPRGHLLVLYHLPKDKGAIRFEYDSMSDQSDFEQLTPGDFQYGELLAFPFLAGLNDDGRADGVRANASTRTREFRIEYQNTAFATPHAKATYRVGIRSMDHFRDFQASYYALLPTFPPFLPPAFPPDYDPTFLFPLPDTGRTKSDFSGTGLGAGLDAEFPLHPRVSILASFSFGLIHGDIDASYVGTNAFYSFASTSGPILITFDDVVEIIALGDQELVDAIFQSEGQASVGVRDRPQMAYEFDLSLAVDFKIWRTLKAYAGYRNLAYFDVGADIRPGAPTLSSNGVFNFQSVESESKSVGYHGYMLGLSYRF